MTKFFLMAGLIPCLLYSQPSLTVRGGTEFSFGDIPSYGTVQRLVTLVNSGNDTLVIDHIWALCECTGTLLNSDHIAPNDSSVLAITFNPTAFSGKVVKTIQTSTNDPANKNVTIKFSASVVKALEIDPDYVFVKTIIDSTTSAPITLNNTGDKDIKILSVKSTNPLVSVKLSDDKISPGKDAIIVTTVTSKTGGMITGNIEFTTDHPLQPLMNIRYRAWVKDVPHPSHQN